jgi:signal peptidase I
MHIILSCLVCTLVIVLLFPTSVGIFMNNNINTDYNSVSVNGVSMEPNISDGDTVLVREVDSIDNIEQGDVIVFNVSCPLTNVDYIIHRVVDKTEHGLVTQGDNNTRVDQLPTFSVIKNTDYENNVYYNPDSGEVNNCYPYVTDDNIESKVVANPMDNPVSKHGITFVESLTELDITR